MKTIEASNLDATVQNWNTIFLTQGPPSTSSEVEKLARDVVKLAADLYGIPVQDLIEGEQISWGGRIGYVGLDFTEAPEGKLWMTTNDQKQNGSQTAEYLWRGFLLNHRTSPRMLRFEDSINSLIGLKPQRT